MVNGVEHLMAKDEIGHMYIRENIHNVVPVFFSERMFAMR